ncbi:MAG: low molecular weight phosphotyrosine protein phosphatase [Oscillospiraceae bacterium]|nr:low molecular weight phosphotyrosine protein phosphatase [Oscillospiraceae bacterium]
MKILFVCLGNICRSPMAEFVLKKMVREAGLDYEIASAATSDEEHGNPVYPPARQVMARHGIDCSGKFARQLTRADYEKYNLLIGMDRSNLRNMQRICGGDPEGKMSLLMDYTDRPGDVADPWYTGDFGIAWRDVNDGCRGLLQYLTEKGT